ncbi:heterokaryon incompatibility protein-domain-containing protein, partial [Hyaloscypha finlandica]
KLTTAWLSECVSAHEGCGGDESSVLPKRVIHVGSEDVNPRLIETIDGQRGRYVTLSYCWGRSISFITTTANFTTHLTGFSTSELPKTIEDAVRFCRHMKIDYLWADCICIIQDDLDDWREESSKMASIYQNSTLTLSATCAESVEKGCFSDEGRIICHRCLFGDLASELRNSGREEDLAQRYPVLTRGWIFQERLLSRRTVHCARGDLFWECLVAKKCECTGDFFDPNERAERQPFHSWRDITIDYNAMWMALVEVHTSRRLTKATDKLVAFSGVAKVFEALLHFPLGEYYAGLWRAYLCLHLCWGRPPRLMPAVAMRTGEPSWSWSSIAEPCSYIIYLPT